MVGIKGANVGDLIMYLDMFGVVIEIIGDCPFDEDSSFCFLDHEQKECCRGTVSFLSNGRVLNWCDYDVKQLIKNRRMKIQRAQR